MPQPPPLADIFQWEVRSWSRAYPLWQRVLRDKVSLPGKALALGERDGGISLLLADHGLETLCSDLHGPTDAARAMHREAGVADLISYASIDTLAIPHPENSFDVVAFKSMIGALTTKERQLQALSEMHRVLKPGGVLLFAENLEGTALHRALRKRFVVWDSYWRYLDPVADLDLFASFASKELRATGLWANLGRSEGQRDVIARFDALMEPLTPLRWHTIWYGAAIKG